MSAFVVNDSTINGFLSYLKLSRDAEWEVRQLAEAAELDKCDDEFWQKLGLSMHILNVQAVNERYDEDNQPSLTYKFKLTLNSNRYQALKSLKCWIYQCSEGDVPETSTLYQAADRVAGEMAMNIVRDLPQYDAADWG